MATDTKYYAVGQGKVYIASRDSTGRTSGWVWMGDADALSITGSQTFLDFQESYSGNRARVIHLPTATDMGFTLQLRSMDKDNISKAFYGTASAITGSTVSAQAFNAYASSTHALGHLNVSSVVVTKTAGSVTLVAGTDYDLDATNGLITFKSGSTNVTGSSAVPCTVSYTYAAADGKVEVLTDSIKDYMLLFVGSSKFDAKAQRVLMHRANFNLATSLSLIGSDVAALNVEGALLAAPEITTAGLSQFVTITQA